MCPGETDKEAELPQALQVYQRHKDLMTKSANVRIRVRMLGVLVVQTSSGVC